MKVATTQSGLLRDSEILNYIRDYGISVRQIPKEVGSSYATSKRNGNNIVRKVLRDMSIEEYNRGVEGKMFGFSFEYENGQLVRYFERTVRIPESAGKWMAKQIKDSSSMVQWSIKDDNLSDTLDGAVLKLVKSLKNESNAG